MSDIKRRIVALEKQANTHQGRMILVDAYSDPPRWSDSTERPGVVHTGDPPEAREGDTVIVATGNVSWFDF